jgi:DNA-binding transcriptional MerR regulator
MSKRNEDTMILISKVAKATGISVNTIRHWARTGQIPAESRETIQGHAWYTTIDAARERAKGAKQGHRRN